LSVVVVYNHDSLKVIVVVANLLCLLASGFQAAGQGWGADSQETEKAGRQRCHCKETKWVNLKSDGFFTFGNSGLKAGK